MPVVLEEFGSKLDVRSAQYKLAYDSCLTSAKRGGSCAGVMFWDLAHKVGCCSSGSCALQVLHTLETYGVAGVVKHVFLQRPCN